MTSGALAAERRLPGEPGIWIVVLGELSVFTIFFGTFVFYRAHDAAVFEASRQTLRQDLGALNTLVLLTSSWLVAAAVHAIRAGRAEQATAALSAALGCGIAFCAVKTIEYAEKVREGVTVTTNDFYMFYFMLTGIHLLHVLVGMGLLVAAGLHVRAARRTATAPSTLLLEVAGCFWHMVDVLWIVLFPLLYLLR